MIDRSKLEYFTMAAWLRGYSEATSKDEYVSPAIAKQLKRAAEMLEYVFNSEINYGVQDDPQQEW